MLNVQVCDYDAMYQCGGLRCNTGVCAHQIACTVVTVLTTHILGHSKSPGAPLNTITALEHMLPIIPSQFSIHHHVQRLADFDDGVFDMLVTISASLGGAPPSASSLRHKGTAPSQSTSTLSSNALLLTLECLPDFAVPPSGQWGGEGVEETVFLDPQGVCVPLFLEAAS